MPSALRAAVLAALVLAGCSRKPEPAAQPAPAPGPGAFTLRDLAAATALDARLARLTLAAGDVQAALPAEPAAGKAGAARERARALLPEVDAALAEVSSALGAIGHPVDRAQAAPVVDAAKAFAGKLAAAVSGDAPGARAELFAARDALGAAISAYRASRGAWRLGAPEPQGAEREFAEARREMERTEMAFGSRTRVAPRESGHEFDPAAARMTGQMATRRAKAAAESLAPPLRDPAVRYAEAQAQALDAVMGLAEAAEAERAAVSRRYHAAKAEALAALADYFAALSTR